MAPERTEIESTIASAIRKALTGDVGEITPDTSLVADLAVDSLDLVEIVYDVEEAYDIQLEPDELFPQRLLRDPNYVRDGALTEAGTAKLVEQFHFTTLPEIAPGTPVADVAAKILTMRVFADYVAYVIDHKSE
jgi:acyl carrier protein